MDAWDAGYRALVPLLNDKRTQELGLAHALMYAKSHYLEAPPSLPLADSRDDFQLVQNWNGWIYSFEPADVPPTLADEFLAVVSEDRWSTGYHGVGPVVSQHSQTPFVSAKGGRVAAVRSFRSPAKMDVSVHISYSARHECGDGTRLSLLLRLDPGSPAVELAARKTLDVPRDDLREDVALEQGSTLHIFSDPLATDGCDEVDLRVTLTVVELASQAWSNLATNDRIAKQAKKQAAAYSPPATTSTDVWAPKATQPADTTDTDDLVYHIALIFDEFRFPHARQLIQSAEHFITSRKVFYHIIAPLSLHPAVYTFFEGLSSAFRLYDHAQCYTHTRAVLPFSDPNIHISAHCKMFLSEIVTFAERVLYLDTDVTIASDISRCYSEPERPRTLISLGVDMGDSCQLQPDLCWPLGLHWRVPAGLACGNVVAEAGDSQLPGCAATGELEPVQANGGVILFELVRMRDWNFVDKYIRSVAHNFRIAGRPAHWGEQDFINSYIRLFPNDFEFLPCGCNFQWWGIRQAVKCGEQPVHIAHHWSVVSRGVRGFHKLTSRFTGRLASQVAGQKSRSTGSSFTSSTTARLQSHPCRSCRPRAKERPTRRASTSRTTSTAPANRTTAYPPTTRHRTGKRSPSSPGFFRNGSSPTSSSRSRPRSTRTSSTSLVCATRASCPPRRRSESRFPYSPTSTPSTTSCARRAASSRRATRTA